MRRSLPKVEIYTTPICPYCLHAKALLKSKGVAFKNIDVMFHPAKRREMEERAGGGYTVPQVFIDGKHVGGADELALLERKGKLDRLLGLGE